MLLDIIEKDLPQLIVGLDSLDDSANYIHIEDVKENINYYCPCCKGLIMRQVDAVKIHIFIIFVRIGYMKRDANLLYQILYMRLIL